MLLMKNTAVSLQKRDVYTRIVCGERKMPFSHIAFIILGGGFQMMDECEVIVPHIQKNKSAQRLEVGKKNTRTKMYFSYLNVI